jgi:hypothetical protein
MRVGGRVRGRPGSPAAEQRPPCFRITANAAMLGALMSVDPDPWQPWYSDLEQACAADDVERIRSTLDAVRLHSHRQRNLHHERWEWLFSALVRLMETEDEEIQRRSFHYVMIVAEAEYGPPYDQHTRADHQRNLACRIDALLPALAARVNREPELFLRCVDELVGTETRAQLEPQASVVHWISSMELPEASRLAARIAYVDARAPWDSIRSFLFATLDHDDVLVRAMAARTIGERYRDGAVSGMAPPFREVVERITEKDILRPGVAGPLLSSWYGWPLGSFEACAEVTLDEWICRILAHRKGREPNMLPCSNGIDFFAHEIFGGRADCIRKILDLGHEALAVEAATEVSERIDDMEPILMDLGARQDDEACRRASWHLAYHHHRLHPDGAKRGFVRQVSLPSADLFLNLSGEADRAPYPCAATLYPRDSASFDDAEAQRLLDAILPPSVRGEMVAYGMPGDGDAPGALVSFCFHEEVAPIARRGATRRRMEPSALAEQRWKRITIIWHGAPEAWSPFRYSADATVGAMDDPRA